MARPGVAARVASVLALALLAACAPLPPAADREPPQVTDTGFEASGRLSARRGSDGITAGFEWLHTPLADAIGLATPLGQTMARLEGTADGAAIMLPDGKTSTARSFDALTEASFGVPLPVSGLAWWIRGAPRPGSAFTVERDARMRTSVLRQDGWEIVYAYADETSVRPRRLVLTYPDVEVRVVIDQWRGS
jgi:outer membrane lipoprotein LolB